MPPRRSSFRGSMREGKHVRARPRRTAVAVGLALVIGGSLAAGSPTSAEQAPTGPSGLAALAQQRGIAIGAEFVQPHYNSGYYRDQASNNFNSITPNRSFKWVHLEPQQGQFAFDESDTIMAFAAEHHLRVRG